MKNYKLAIVGATGLVGRTALKVLEEKSFPNLEYKLFCSKKSAGTKVKFMGKEYIANELTENSFDEGFNFAIFSAGGETSKKFAPIAASKGCIVIDNSSAFRMDKNVPLVVPEVNPDDIFWNTGIIANPNCSTIQAVVALKPLDDKYKIKRIIYSTYQAVSGAGVNALEDLHSQASYNNLKKFSHPIYNNCLPHIDVFMDDGYTKEEHKMINETKKILGNENLKITATTVRVPIENCHGESINIEFEKEEIDKKVAKNDFQIEDILGDMVICIPKVEEQAEEYGHSFERELSYMVVHSFYHLMGYDHMEEEPKKEMRQKEEYILKQLGITRENK